ncbi:hypothetical protein RCO48_20560 [Peribacillus frigoritolerans]|nr:hypothetical protein [Peribacillus frigoritolerans]
MIPLVFITYSLAYLDRANYGFGVAGGMGEDLNITAGVSSFLAALFFLGYFFFQVPGAHYAEKKSAKILIFLELDSLGRTGDIDGDGDKCGMALSDSLLAWCC